eukprot:Skav232406  [mRNA]  locus=scaffold1077:799224:806483:- [translate_table: standard]
MSSEQLHLFRPRTERQIPALPRAVGPATGDALRGCHGAAQAQIQERILQAQPILESFGNAVTMRSTTPLLQPGDAQRTLGGTAAAVAAEAAEARAAHQRGAGRERRRERDQKNFQRLCDALRVVGFTEGDMESIFQVLAGLVHLGEESSYVELDEEVVGKAPIAVGVQAASLLGMDSDELSSALRRRKVRVVHPGRESVHEAGGWGGEPWILDQLCSWNGLQLIDWLVVMTGAQDHVAVPSRAALVDQGVVQAALRALGAADQLPGMPSAAPATARMGLKG